jgi:hypothetical protein
MSKYAILIYGDESTYADLPPEAWQAMIDAHDAFSRPSTTWVAPSPAVRR